MDTNELIRRFLTQTRFAVAGASLDRTKYGNKVLRCYQQAGRAVVAIHPREVEIEGARAYARISDVPEPPQGLSIITPPRITEGLIEEAAAAGVKHVWMQPGAESVDAVRRGQELGLEIIAGGPCLLVVLGFEG